MARINNNLWNRYRYKINGFLLILPCYFFYQSLFPEFPNAWETKSIGEFSVTPTPYNLKPPYLHHGSYSKDFMLMFNKGDIDDIRQAYLNIGKEALPLTVLQVSDKGILHGSVHGQEVHAISANVLKPSDKIWLTIENWKGQQFITSWSLPKELLN
ncbi:hypothetical protein [Cognaticolwellia mytili]|uniref:hypothetical protein n=1 Tax=Cognaticolwellia mytili TaxID=1888913 RepID=UPI000A17795A|nr:hypothetical protein [Cognaticolwellia mytili]